MFHRTVKKWSGQFQQFKKGWVAPNLAKVLGRRQVHIRRHGRQELPVRNVVDIDSKDDQARS
jgi:hypothetical protein